MLSVLSLVDANTMVHAYLTHAEVACKYPSSTHFEPALKVFSRQEFTLLLEGHAQVEQPPVTLEDIQRRLTALKDQLTARNERYDSQHMSLWIEI